jgi:hypothetical protein
VPKTFDNCAEFNRNGTDILGTRVPIWYKHLLILGIEIKKWKLKDLVGMYQVINGKWI